MARRGNLRLAFATGVACTAVVVTSAVLPHSQEPVPVSEHHVTTLAQADMLSTLNKYLSTVDKIQTSMGKGGVNFIVYSSKVNTHDLTGVFNMASYSLGSNTPHPFTLTVKCMREVQSSGPLSCTVNGTVPQMAPA